VLGGLPECLQRPFCLLGLQQTYGTQFKGFKPLDAGGMLTVAALDAGEIDVGLLLTTDPNIARKSLVDERTVRRCVKSGQLAADKRGGRFPSRRR